MTDVTAHFENDKFELKSYIELSEVLAYACDYMLKLYKHAYAIGYKSMCYSYKQASQICLF